MKYLTNFIIFIQENAFEKVGCKIAVILSRPQWVEGPACASV